MGANGAGKSALAGAIPLLAGGLLGGASEELTASGDVLNWPGGVFEEDYEEEEEEAPLLPGDA